MSDLASPAPASQITSAPMSNSPLPTSLSDLSSAIDRLESTGSNWIVFQYHFTIAVKQKRVWSQFDGSNTKPSGLGEGATAEQRQEYSRLVSAWQECEDLALYLLSMKLPNAIFTKYQR